MQWIKHMFSKLIAAFVERFRDKAYVSKLIAAFVERFRDKAYV